MNLSEAYSIFGLNKSATDEEIKKQYKKLTRTYHPDINKDPNAETKFKEINNAYEVLQKRNEKKPVFNFVNNFEDEDFEENFEEPQPIFFKRKISFKEAIYGTTIKLEYDRNVGCQSCNGDGFSKKNNGCKTCNGTGTVITRGNNVISSTTCNSCKGKVDIESCKSCNGSGSYSKKTAISVKVPPGIESGNVLSLGGMGNFGKKASHAFIRFFGPNYYYTDAFLQVEYDKDENIKMLDKNIVMSTNIDLLTALKGGKTNVTLFDETIEVPIKEKTSNKDTYSIPKKGIGNDGSLIVEFIVNYPKDVKNIISLLENELSAIS